MDGCGWHFVLDMPQKRCSDASVGVIQLRTLRLVFDPLGTQEGRDHVT